MRILPRSSILAVLTLIVTLAFGSGVASAHAKLASSVPAADSTVLAPPATVTATFDNHDPLDGTKSKLSVTDASGAVVDNGDMTLDKSDADRKTLAVSLKSGLGDGIYTVSWTAVSEGDGSQEEGSFKFTVGSTGPAVSPPTSLPNTGEGDALPFVAIPASLVLMGAGVLLRCSVKR